MPSAKALESTEFLGAEVKDNVAVLLVLAEGAPTAKVRGHHLSKEMGSQPFFGQAAHPFCGSNMS